MRESEWGGHVLCEAILERCGLCLVEQILVND